MPEVTEAVDEFLHELDQWERAYPLSAFPEPDLGRAAELLKAGGMTLDAISASNMRHVVSKIAPKARAAITAMRALEPRASSDGERAGERRVVHELRLSARVFRDYALQHIDKADAANDSRERDNRLRKAKRNSERADACEEALRVYDAALQSQPPSNEARLREALEAELHQHVDDAERLGMDLMDGSRSDAERAAIRGRLDRAIKRAGNIRAALSNEGNG